MYRKCSVVHCVKKPNTSFHRISPNADKRSTWLFNLNLPLTTTGRICSEHFEEADFVTRNNRRYLHPNAVPKMLLHRFNENEQINEVVVGDAAVEVVMRRDVYEEHNYSKKPKIQKSTVQRSNFLLVRNQNLRRTIRNLHKEIRKLKHSHKEEQKKFENFDKLSEFVQNFVLLLIKHHDRKSSPRQYSPIIRKFALSLHYYSPAGYRFVRDEFHNCLPHPHTIAEWYRVIDGNPGFTNESLDAITTLQENTPFKIVVSIVLDGMAIRKLLRRIGNKVVGYTDLGGVIPDVDDKNQLANEALIFLAVGVNVAFKAPIGHFLINGLTGKQLAYLVEIATILLIKCKVVPGALIFDGPKAHFTMARELGCNFQDMNNPITSFQVEGHTLYIFPDMCHMLKLSRNFVCDEGSFLDGEKRTISWKYFENLHNFQTSQGIHVANKLRRLHVMYKNQIMKVYLATQLFSESVADAIEFCDKTLKLPDFKYSEGTVNFIRVMNDIFDIFNSRDMKDDFYKQPLNQNNYVSVADRLEYARKYLLQLTQLDGTPVYLGARKTFVVGMLCLIASLLGFYEEFVEKRKLLKYVPTYRMSQDSVEIFNCSMRSHSGYNTNPSALALQTAYKKTLLHIQFHEKFTGNCRPLEDIPILNQSSKRRRIDTTAQFITDEEMDQSMENALMPPSFRKNWEGYYCVIAYIAGYIARRLTVLLKCPECSQALIHQSDETADFIFACESDEDHGYDDTMDDVEDNIVPIINVGYSERNILDDNSIGYDDEDDPLTVTEGVGFIDDNEIDEAGIDEGIEEEDGQTDDHYHMDLAQVEEIARNYLSLIKQKDRGGLFYPSDSLYRTAILADIVFCTALKESGGKMLHRKWTLNRLVVYVSNISSEYSDTIFTELKSHFTDEPSHDTLIESIGRFYLKMRMDFLNKTVSANSGKRQKLMHSIHFAGM